MKEVLRHIWQTLGAGKTGFHSFSFEYFVQAIRYFRCSWGAA